MDKEVWSTSTKQKLCWRVQSLNKKTDCPAGIKIGYERAKARYEQKKQFVEPTGRKENICYESFTTSVDESVEEIVALASTLGMRCDPDIREENEYFYGDESTDWSKQHVKVCMKNKLSQYNHV